MYMHEERINSISIQQCLCFAMFCNVPLRAKLELKPQIKINQNNTKIDPLSKIETFIRNSKRKTLPNLKITQT